MHSSKSQMIEYYDLEIIDVFPLRRTDKRVLFWSLNPRANSSLQ